MLFNHPVMKLHDTTIEINQGRRFPLTKSYLLFVFLSVVFATSFLIPFSSVYVGFQLVSVVLILFLYTANTGMIIKGNRVMFYVGAFFFRRGTWKKFEGYTCIVMKTTRKKRVNAIINLIGDSNSITEKFITTELYFMNSIHRKKIFCCSFESYSDAEKFANELSQKTNFPIEVFSPLIQKRRR